MAAPSYGRNGYLAAPALEVGTSGLIGGPVVSIYGNFGLQPAATGADKIVDQILLPGGTLDVAGQYIYISVLGTTAANVNSKTWKVFLGGTGAVGATITGGTVIGSVVTTASAELMCIDGYIMKTGASTQNVAAFTQHGTTSAITSGTATATDTGNILINLTMNNATTAADSTVTIWCVQFSM